MVPSSAKTRPISRIMIAPITQEMMAAGPASVAAVSARNSQPEPMMEPTLANNRPTTPMSRRILPLDGSAWAVGRSRSVVIIRLLSAVPGIPRRQLNKTDVSAPGRRLIADMDEQTAALLAGLNPQQRAAVV